MIVPSSSSDKTRCKAEGSLNVGVSINQFLRGISKTECWVRTHVCEEAANRGNRISIHTCEEENRWVARTGGVKEHQGSSGNYGDQDNDGTPLTFVGSIGLNPLFVAENCDSDVCGEIKPPWVVTVPELGSGIGTSEGGRFVTGTNRSVMKIPCESRHNTPNNRRSGDGSRERFRIKTTFPKSPSLSKAAKDVENSGPLPFAGNTI